MDPVFRLALQAALDNIEGSLNAVIAAQNAADAANAAAAAAQTAADNAQTAADTAQASADTVAATVAGLDIPPSGQRTVTADTSVTATDGTINVDTTAGMVVVTLLGAAAPSVTIKKISADANVARIAAQAGDTINGAATFDFTTQGETHVCTNNQASEWYA
jgi:F0F1-type ATP synthase assembly protein I